MDALCPRFIAILLFHLYVVGSVDIVVQRGEISAIDSSTAIAGMSGNAAPWFQLLNSSSHPEAFLKYMGISDGDNFQAAVANASVAQYFDTTGIVPGVGRITTRISTLLFKCLDSNCLSFSPLVLNASGSEFYSTWKVLYDSTNRSIMVNPTVADISTRNRVVSRAGGLELLVEDNMQRCNSQVESSVLAMSNAYIADSTAATIVFLTGRKMQIFASRTALEAVDPGKGIDGCYKLNLTVLGEFGDIFGIDFGNVGETLVVLGFSISLGGDLQDTAKATLQLNLEVLFTKVDVSQCGPGSRMLINNIIGSAFTVCSAANDTGIARCWIADVRADESTSCIYQSLRMIQALLQNDTNFIREAETFYRDCFQVQNLSLPTLLPRSINVSESNDLGLHNARNNGAICTRDTGMRLDSNVMELLLTGVKNTYVEKHKELFDLDNGPPTDFWTAVITILSSFVSVMAAVAPLTSIELTVLRKLGCEIAFRRRHLKLTLLALFNVVLAYFFYLPVLLLAKDELERQKEYKTWALISEDFKILMEGATSALLVVTGSSVYHSKIIVMAVVFGVLSPIVVAAITVSKSCQIINDHKES